MNDGDDSEWRAILAGGPATGRLAVFAPITAPPTASDGCMVVGRLAQTLDGRIATEGGASQWIGGEADLLHTHRLRALCHAVVVGGGTAAADDPQLTTRLCRGPNPLRVVLDADARLSSDLRLFAGGPPTLRVVAADAAPASGNVLRLPRDAQGHLDLHALLAALAARGLTRVFVEGGGITVSRFLTAGLLDRLHVSVAPIILGSGRPAFSWPGALSVADGMRFGWTVHDLAPDVLFDIALNRARPPATA